MACPAPVSSLSVSIVIPESALALIRDPFRDQAPDGLPLAPGRGMVPGSTLRFGRGDAVSSAIEIAA